MVSGEPRIAVPEKPAIVLPTAQDLAEALEGEDVRRWTARDELFLIEEETNRQSGYGKVVQDALRYGSLGYQERF